MHVALLPPLPPPAFLLALACDRERKVHFRSALRVQCCMQQCIEKRLRVSSSRSFAAYPRIPTRRYTARGSGGSLTACVYRQLYLDRAIASPSATDRTSVRECIRTNICRSGGAPASARPQHCGRAWCMVYPTPCPIHGTHEHSYVAVDHSSRDACILRAICDLGGSAAMRKSRTPRPPSPAPGVGMYFGCCGMHLPRCIIHNTGICLRRWACFSDFRHDSIPPVCFGF
jgi:hypothetical protein